MWPDNDESFMVMALSLVQQSFERDFDSRHQQQQLHIFLYLENVAHF